MPSSPAGKSIGMFLSHMLAGKLSYKEAITSSCQLQSKVMWHDTSLCQMPVPPCGSCQNGSWGEASEASEARGDSEGAVNSPAVTANTGSEEKGRCLNLTVLT